MPHPQASSDVGSKHSFASTSEARTLTDIQVAVAVVDH